MRTRIAVEGHTHSSMKTHTVVYTHMEYEDIYICVNIYIHRVSIYICVNAYIYRASHPSKKSVSAASTNTRHDHKFLC
jgi:hypothetical protein